MSTHMRRSRRPIRGAPAVSLFDIVIVWSARSRARAVRFTAELEKRRARAREEEKRLRGACQHALNLLELVDDYLADLPWLVDPEPVIRDYETVAEPRTEENLLGVYTLTPESIRFHSEEELADKRRVAEEERAARYRSVYDALGLQVVAYKDETLKITWVGDRRVLQPSSRSQESTTPSFCATLTPGEAAYRLEVVA